MPGIPFHRRLSVRLAVAAAAVTFAPIALLCVLSIREHGADLVGVVVRETAIFSDTIRSSTHDLMLGGHQDLAYRLMGSLGGRPGIEKVRVLNEDGRVTFSSDSKERGVLVDRQTEACVGCHAADRPLARLPTKARTRIFTAGDHRVLAMITAIPNEPACSSAACHVHSAERKILGVVDVGVSLAEVDAAVTRQARRQIAISLVALAALVALLVAAVHRLVLRPVSELADATRRLGHGESTPELTVHARDELGALEGSFNEMSTSLASARAELQALADGLETEVEERTARLKTAQDAALHGEKLASLGTLSASIAHEINNPLAGILVSSRLMIRMLRDGPLSPADTARCAKNLGLIERETERCTAIVRNLLDFAKARPIDVQHVEIHRVLDEALALTQHKLQLQNVTIERETPAALAVPGDFGQLRQVFVNLLLNAADAMPKGGVVTVTTRVAGDGRAEVAVRDTGEGIAPENLSKIFDPFFTTKEMGTGMGLSVVYGIVQKHGGEVRVASGAGAGTTMTIRLPVLAGAAAEPAGPAAAA